MKNEPKPRRGIFQETPDGPWKIRYTDGGGIYRRETAGSWSLAVKLLDKRRGEAVQGKKLPETLRRRFVPFSEIAEDCLAWSKAKKRSTRVDHSRMKKLLEWLGTMSVGGLHHARGD